MLKHINLINLKRIFGLRRTRAATAAVLLVIVLTLAVIYNPAVVGVSATTRELPIYCVNRDNKAVSLTFDAAWGNEDTQQLIDIFAKYNIKVTCFVVGAWVDKYPESVKALHDAGHEVMSHSNNHEHFSKLSASQIVENLNTANKKISDITGVTPTLFRAPYGEYDDNVIKTVRSIGMETIQWDVDSLHSVGVM